MTEELTKQSRKARPSKKKDKDAPAAEQPVNEASATATTEGDSMSTENGEAKTKTKRAKREKAEKTEKRKRNGVISGTITKVESHGDTYLRLVFEEGHITLTPTGNRTPNRDAALKGIRALINA